jgi:hypothetical protein
LDLRFLGFLDAMNSFEACLPSADPLVVSTPTCSRRSLSYISRETSWGTPILLPSQKSKSLSKDFFDDVNLGGGFSTGGNNDEHWNTLNNIAALGLSFNTENVQLSDTKKVERFSLEDIKSIVDQSLPLESDRPFNRWMRNLQRRGTQMRKTLSGNMDTSELEWELFESPVTRQRSDHKKSSSGSSFGFVTAVKSASISLASLSVAPRSRRTGVSSRHQRADHSSKASNVGRLSEDSSYIAGGVVIDQAVTNRLLQRRRVLEEIINTEENYVGDIKFLMNVGSDIDDVREWLTVC